MIIDPSHSSGRTLRERMIEDMTVRGFTEDTRRDYPKGLKRWNVALGSEHSNSLGAPEAVTFRIEVGAALDSKAAALSNKPYCR